MKDSVGLPVVNGFRMVEFGSFKDTMKTVCSDLRMDDSLVYTSASEIVCKGRQDFYLGHDGGYMIPMYSKIGQGMRNHFEKLVSWYGKNDLFPVYLENNIFNFYLNREVKSTETDNVNNAQQSGNEYGRAVRS